MKQTIEEIAKKHAIECHQKINHKYDNDKDYEYHLQLVKDMALTFQHHIPEDDRDDIFAVAWEHDTLEDCKDICSFADLVKITNLRVAMIVKAVTTGEGTRKERMSDEYYRKIRNTKYATFIKLCDRIANVNQGILNRKTIINMYRKEHQHFKEMLYVAGEYEDMWKLLDQLISE